MEATVGFSLATLGLFLLGLGGQVLGISLLPRTNGFTDPVWTAASLVPFIASLWFISILFRQGASLSIVAPLLSATVPMATIAVAYFAYGEPISAMKLLILAVACILIGLAGSLR